MGYPSTYLIGVRDMETKFSEMMEAKLFCDARNLSYPKEVQEYFGDQVGESESYLRSEMEHITLAGVGGDGICNWTKSMPVRDVSDEDTTAVEIDLKDLPEGLKALRLKMTW